MNPKKKICSQCNDEKPIWKNFEGEKYCKHCWLMIKAKEIKPKKPRSKINQKSKKREKLDLLYSKMRIQFLTDKPVCEANLPNCTSVATDVHHKAGRGRNYLVIDTWFAACRSCHSWIEEHPIEAREAGYSTTKL
jgi:hypothetical protein